MNTTKYKLILILPTGGAVDVVVVAYKLTHDNGSYRFYDHTSNLICSYPVNHTIIYTLEDVDEKVGMYSGEPTELTEKIKLKNHPKDLN